MRAVQPRDYTRSLYNPSAIELAPHLALRLLPHQKYDALGTETPDDQRSGTADLAQNLVAHRPLYHAALFHRIYRPREHRLRVVDDEQGPRLFVRGLRFRRWHLLPGLLSLRSAVERDLGKSGCPAVDRPRH